MKRLSLKEAQKLLEDMKVDIPLPKAAVTRNKQNIALDMAIKALNCVELFGNSEQLENCEDMISRQAAIDALDGEVTVTGRANAEAVRGYANLICDRIKRLPSVQPERKKDEWIPISKETNPAKSGWYLVTVHENAIFDNERFTAMAEFNATDGVWYDIDEPTDMYLRWMPLPEPYKGE